ncbi:response regulator transcription factor [Streptosporangium amethystogenes]|uniref:response regulator transcription factor n=1 Tax=Streptosporangium amethystogenes TaxID=2002 RepID=UPI003CD06777
MALLASGGLTNREIGAKLFVSPRTVQAQLSSVFAKLGLSSRSATTPVAQRILKAASHTSRVGSVAEPARVLSRHSPTVIPTAAAS